MAFHIALAMTCGRWLNVLGAGELGSATAGLSGGSARLGVFLARLTQPCQPSPEGVAGSACTSTFSRSHDVLWVAIDSASK